MSDSVPYYGSFRSGWYARLGYLFIKASILAGNPWMTFTEWRKLSGIHATTARNLLDQMLQGGLIEFRRSRSDHGESVLRDPNAEFHYRFENLMPPDVIECESVEEARAAFRAENPALVAAQDAAKERAEAIRRSPMAAFRTLSPLAILVWSSLSPDQSATEALVHGPWEKGKAELEKAGLLRHAEGNCDGQCEVFVAGAWLPVRQD